MSSKDKGAARGKASQNGAADRIPEPELDRLDQVRDILFGHQARATDDRFGRLERKLTEEAKELRDQLKKRFDELEKYIKSEVAQVLGRVETEANAREQLDDRVRVEQEGLEKQMAEQAQDLRDENRQQRDELMEHHERGFDELSSKKLDQSTLAELFSELAARITDELEDKKPRR